MMLPKERQLAAIRREEVDRISVDVICIENQPEIADLLGISVEGVYDALGIDGRIVAAPYCGEAVYGYNGEPATEWRTVTTTDYGTAHWYPLANAASLEDVERFSWPDPSDYNYDAVAQAAAELAKTYAVRGPYWKPVFCQACELLGMEEAMIRMSVEPLIFEAVLDHVFQSVYGYCERLLNACGDNLPIFALGDDFATQRGLMISPEDWRRFLKPLYAQLFNMAKSKGKHVWFHSCGDITSILPDLIDIGMDVWETVQLHALPMSAEQLKRNYGKNITFFGGINTQRLPFATPEQVRTEVIEAISTLGKGGGYICGPDHHIKPDVSAINAVTLFNTATSASQCLDETMLR